jgi:hypothetical protein
MAIDISITQLFATLHYDRATLADALDRPRLQAGFTQAPNLLGQLNAANLGSRGCLSTLLLDQF